MELFIVVIAIAFLQVWGADNPLHYDAWFRRWEAYLVSKYHLAGPRLVLSCVGLPLLLVLFAFTLIKLGSVWLMLPVGSVVLLYSLGRGEFSNIVNEYTKACQIEDWPSALTRASTLGVNVDNVEVNDWSSLHWHVLKEAGYRGFERMFAVLFWFFVLGPFGAVGALMYRLVFLFCRKEEGQSSAFAEKWLWLMEWPAVRLLGLSFAVTGNFVGCYTRLKESLFCAKRPTIEVLSQSILGALSVSEEQTQSCEVTRAELSLLHQLYKRTLWFWLAAASFFMIFV